MVHPDQDSETLAQNTELIRFGLDVLLEKPNSGAFAEGFDTVVEEVELCSLAALPEDFNGPGFLHPLSGNLLQTLAKYRMAQLLEGAAVKFELSEASQVTFYLAVPEGLSAEAVLVRLQGTRTTRVTTEGLNKDDESFLRQQNGFQHRGVIQLREFLDPGAYMIKMQGRDLAGGKGVRVMPRCEAYELGLTVTPLKAAAVHPVGVECLESEYVPEHLSFDEFKNGHLAYPVSESTVDVAYLDLKGDGEGPFLFHF